MSLYEKEQRSEAQAESNDGNRMNAKTRASILFSLSVAVFLFVVVTCLSLIRKSAEVPQPETFESHISGIKYNDVAPDVSEQTGESGETDENGGQGVIDDPQILNYLIAALDRETEQTDSIMILNVNTGNSTAALLSIPKDTYVSGGYDIPKANRIYGSYDQKKAEALTEAAGDMLGFDLNGYVIFDESDLALILDALGGIEFDVPNEPEYHSLPTGEQSFHDAEAFRIFCYREDYTDIETDSTQLQREFLLRILGKLTEDQLKTAEYASLITENTETNISQEMLTYLADILKDFDFESAYEAALPGEEIRVDGEDYFEVNEEKACKSINEHFNPLAEDLTDTDLQFRQKHDEDGIGVDPVLPNYTTTRPSENETEPDESTDDGTLLPEPTESESTDDESSEPSDDGELLPEPTEESSQDDTTEPTENPDPLEPAEPDGDE